MKKTPKSITVTVERRKGYDISLWVGDEFIGEYEVERAFGKVPPTPYKLTYTVNSKGKYFMSDAPVIGINKPGKHTGVLCTCFLEETGWENLRVSRKVTPIRKAVKK